MTDYRARSMTLHRNVSYMRDGTWQSARAVAIDDAGGLVVRAPDGAHTTLRTGEITLRHEGTGEATSFL